MVYDEILAYPVWRSTRTGLTATLTTRYLSRTPLITTFRFIAYIERTEKKKIFVRGEIFGYEDEKTAEQYFIVPESELGNNKKIVYNEGNGIWVDVTSKFGNNFFGQTDYVTKPLPQKRDRVLDKSRL